MASTVDTIHHSKGCERNCHGEYDLGGSSAGSGHTLLIAKARLVELREMDMRISDRIRKAIFISPISMFFGVGGSSAGSATKFSCKAIEAWLVSKGKFDSDRRTLQLADGRIADCEIARTTCSSGATAKWSLFTPLIPDCHTI